uniref:integrase core domain-containing protein n=1 Tax=Serratia marcescens TaxID=615 RepID=UPI00402BA22A
RHLVEQVTAIRLHQPRLGTRKLHHLLRQRPEPALHVGRDRLFSILRCARLLVMPKRAYHKTTQSHHRFYRHPNLLKAGDNQVIASRPEQVWVADITYLPLVHHSDRGIQYCSQEYQALHQRYGITCSMTDGYDCYPNALAERVNGILKTEYLLGRPEDIVQAKKMVRESVNLYNAQRPHLSLKYKTPDEVHRALSG